MKYPYLLFDADDTLFDFPQASAHAFAALCQLQDIPNTQETRELYRTINHALWAAFDRREITKEQVVHDRFTQFLSKLGLDRDPDQCNQDYLDVLSQFVFPLPYAEEVCRELAARGHKLYIITNAVASVQRRRLDVCTFGEVFSGAFISEEAGAAKPELAYYDYVFSQVPELTRNNCLVIGDSLTSDIPGANNAGLPCCWFNPQKKPADPALRIDYEIQDLRELLAIV